MRQPGVHFPPCRRLRSWLYDWHRIWCGVGLRLLDDTLRAWDHTVSLCLHPTRSWCRHASGAFLRVSSRRGDTTSHLETGVSFNGTSQVLLPDDTAVWYTHRLLSRGLLARKGCAHSHPPLPGSHPALACLNATSNSADVSCRVQSSPVPKSDSSCVSGHLAVTKADAKAARSCLEMMHAFCAWNPHQAPNRISACEELR